MLDRLPTQRPFGGFYFRYHRDRYLDRLFAANMITNLMITNLGRLLNTWLIDALVYGEDSARMLSNTPILLIAP